MSYQSQFISSRELALEVARPLNELSPEAAPRRRERVAQRLADWRAQYEPPRPTIVVVQSAPSPYWEPRWATVAIRGCDRVAAMRAAKRLVERRWHLPRRFLVTPFLH